MKDNKNKHTLGPKSVTDSSGMSAKKKVLWSLLFVIIAVMSIWAVTSQNANFSLAEFGEFLSELNPWWFTAAVAAMLGYVLFEALSIMLITKSFGYKQPLRKGIIYSTSDIYFSAITPSATGGQPASAYFMTHDGIPASITTVTLFLNLIMYTFAIIALGILCFILKPSLFLGFSTFSKVMIVIGCACQVGIALIFMLLLRKSSWLYKLGDLGLRLLAKLRLIKRLEERREGLREYIASYEESVSQLRGKRKLMAGAFLLNFLQRASLIAVTVFIYLASSGVAGKALDVWVSESMVILGSNTVPIPGAMGIKDYLLLDAFEAIGLGEDATHLELLSRAVSFYFCVLLCGISMFARVVAHKIHVAWLRKHHRKQKNQNNQGEA